MYLTSGSELISALVSYGEVATGFADCYSPLLLVVLLSASGLLLGFGPFNVPFASLLSILYLPVD